MAAIALLLGLTGCGGPPWTVSRSTDAIALRWYPDDTDIATVDRLAERHCRSLGRTAQLAADARYGSAEVALYRCR